MIDFLIWYFIIGFFISFFAGLVTAGVYDHEGRKIGLLEIVLLLGIITIWPLYLFLSYKSYQELKKNSED